MAAFNKLLPRLSRARGISRKKQAGFLRLSMFAARWGSRPFRIQDLFRGGEQGAHFETYDPQLLLRRVNLLSYSEVFDNTDAWTGKVGTAVAASPGVTAPDGTTTAYKLTETAVSSSHHISQTPSKVGYALRASIYAKAGELSSFALSLSGGSGYRATFNVATGVVVQQLGGVNATIEAVGNGWYRCSMDCPDVFTTNGFYIHARDYGSFVGDGVSGLYIWGAQLESGAITTSYQRVTDWNTEYMAAALESIGMWQDSTGTTPVTAVEQPVGLWLDGKAGKWTRGPELVSNGDNEAAIFSCGVLSLLGVTPTRVANPSGAGFVAQAASSDSSSGAKEIAMGTNVPAGMSVEIAGRFYLPAGGISNFKVFDFSDGSWFGVTASTQGQWVSFRCMRPAKASNWRIGIGDNTNSSIAAGVVAFYVDDLSIKLFSGNHSSQSGSTKRPLLSARVNLLTKTEQLDDAAWLKQFGGTGAAPTVTPNAGTDPLGGNTADRVVLNRGAGGTTADYALLQQQVSGSVVGAPYIGAIFLKSYSGATQNVVVYINTGGDISAVQVAVGNSWVKVQPGNRTATGTNIAFSIITRGGSFSPNTNYGGDQNVDLLVWGADLRTADDAAKNIPAYQRVNTPTDFDTDGFVHYERLDGLDDNQVASSGGGGAAGFLFCAAVTPDGAGTSRVLWSDMGTNTGYRVMVNSSNQLQLTAGDGAASTSVSTAGTVDVNTTHVVTAWDDGVNLNVQIDNGTVASVARPSVAAGTAGFTIGSTNGASSGFYKGRIYGKTYRQSDCGQPLREKLKRYHARLAGITI